MRKERIDGIGSVCGGEYESIEIEGIGKLRGNTTAEIVSVDGLIKITGKLDVGTYTINGGARCFRDVKAQSVYIDGVLKLRRASLRASEIVCDGIIVCTNEVSADKITIDGICSIHLVTGDTVKILNHSTNVNGKMPHALYTFSRMYFGRDVCLEYSSADTVECTSLEAHGFYSETVRAQNVNIANKSHIEKLYCDGEVTLTSDCRIDKIITSDGRAPNVRIIQSDNGASSSQNNFSEGNVMANAAVAKILEMYKAGNLNADEAEIMLTPIISGTSARTDDASHDINVLWNDDGKLRIVAFIGRKLLKKGEAEALNFSVTLDGETLNTECYGNLSCGNIKGNANAGGGINCGSISGNVAAGGGISCTDIGGNVAAGGGVTLHK